MVGEHCPVNILFVSWPIAGLCGIATNDYNRLIIVKASVRSILGEINRNNCSSCLTDNQSTSTDKRIPGLLKQAKDSLDVTFEFGQKDFSHSNFQKSNF